MNERHAAAELTRFVKLRINAVCARLVDVAPGIALSPTRSLLRPHGGKAFNEVVRLSKLRINDCLAFAIYVSEQFMSFTNGVATIHTKYRQPIAKTLRI